MAIEKRIEIPAGVTAEFDGVTLTVTGPRGTLIRRMYYPRISIGIEDGEFVVSTESDRRNIMAMCGTYAAHAGNMCIGVVRGYTYRMKVVYSHFPIQLKQQGKKLEIINFLGEKQPRSARIDDGVDIKVGNDEITLSGNDIEIVGMTAARIERATRVRKRDPRIFQDGIYIVEKAVIGDA